MLTFSLLAPARRSMRRLVAVGAAVAAVTACKGLTSIDASFDNVSDTLSVFALNGASPAAPTAINLFTGIPQHADQAFAYDLAFDIDTAGRVVLIPARALATQFSSPYSVGLQKVAGSFGSVDRAPKSGYTADSLMVIGLGNVVVIESHDAARCGFAIKGQSYFSKLVVDSVDVASRRIHALVFVNRNCGFYSFATGKPKD